MEHYVKPKVPGSMPDEENTSFRTPVKPKVSLGAMPFEESTDTRIFLRTHVCETYPQLRRVCAGFHG